MKIHFIITLLCLSNISLGQESLLINEFEAKINTQYSSPIVFVDQEKKQTHLLHSPINSKARTETPFVHYVMNEKFDLLHSNELWNNSTKKLYRIGQFETKDQFHFAYLQDTTYYKMDISKSDYAMKQSVFDINLELKEKIVGTLESKDALYILTSMNKNKRGVGIYKIDNYAEVSKHIVRMPLVSRLNDKLDSIYTVKYQKDIPLSKAATPYKAYCFDNKIVLSFEEENNSIHSVSLYTIDLDSFKVSSKKINISDKLRYKNKPYTIKDGKSTSYIADGKLFFAITNTKYFFMGIVDIDTEKLLAHYNFSDAKNINFKNTNLLKKKLKFPFFDFPQSTKKYKNPDNFLTHIANNDLGLVVNTKSNNHIITMGAYTLEKEEPDNLPSFYSYDPLSSTYRFNGITSGPSIIEFPTKLTYFKTVLDRSDFAHQKTSLNELAEYKFYDACNQWTIKMRKKGHTISHPSYFRLGNHYFYVCYDQYEMKYKFLSSANMN